MPIMIVMKEHGEMDKEMEMEFINTQTEIYMKDSG